MSEDVASEVMRLLVKDIMVKNPLTVYSEGAVREAALAMEPRYPTTNSHERACALRYLVAS